MAVHAHPITCDGKDFATIREFANYYGLNYSKAQYYRKRGKTPEEILKACQFSSASKSEKPAKSTAKRFLCEYQGVQYSSLYEAANALGFPPAQLYELRKRNNLPPSAAIELAMEKRAAKGKRESSRAQKCIIDGIEYKSQDDAIRAFGLPRITVYSRMERDGISFEEAVLKGRKAATYCPPTPSLFPTLRLVQTESIEQPTLSELQRSLSYYKKRVTCMQDVRTCLPALCIEDSIYLYFNSEAHGLEFISVLPITLTLDTLNAINSAYANTKLYCNPMTNQVILSAFQAAKEEGQEIKTLLYAYFSYEAIRQQLLRNFSTAAIPASTDAVITSV